MSDYDIIDDETERDLWRRDNIRKTIDPKSKIAELRATLAKTEKEDHE